MQEDPNGKIDHNDSRALQELLVGLFDKDSGLSFNNFISPAPQIQQWFTTLICGNPDQQITIQRLDAIKKLTIFGTTVGPLRGPKTYKEVLEQVGANETTPTRAGESINKATRAAGELITRLTKGLAITVQRQLAATPPPLS